MKGTRLPGYLLFAMLVVLTGSSTLRGDLFGNALTDAFARAWNTPSISADEVETDQADYSQLVETLRVNPQKIEPLAPTSIDTETLWLARAIYSETKRAEEMELVAWVIRNRVETGYRGRGSYRDVVLDPFQFSAFNRGNQKRTFYANLSPGTDSNGWQQALAIAHRVRLAEPVYRPFSITTRHFYSERSMPDRPHPSWASGKRPVVPKRKFSIDERRFRFFEGVS